MSTSSFDEAEAVALDMMGSLKLGNFEIFLVSMKVHINENYTKLIPYAYVCMIIRLNIEVSPYLT